MAGNSVRIESMHSSVAMPITGTVYTQPADTAGAAFYTTSIHDVPGVVAANNFISVFNPSGSGKTLIFYALFVIPWAIGVTTGVASMRIDRISASSGGTLVPTTSIGKFITSSPNSVAEVRTGNPTLTKVGLSIGSFPPPLTGSKQGASSALSNAGVGGASFACLPGEGISYSTSSGDVDQMWNLGFIWSEH